MARVSAALVAAAVLWPAVSASAQGRSDGPPAKTSPTAGRRPVITGGYDGSTAWMTAVHGQLQIRKRMQLETQTMVAELRAGADVVVLTLSPEAVSVARGGRTVTLDSPAALEAVLPLIGASPAVFATKVLLSELEADSPLDAADISLLSTAAFVASLVGDIQAPRRIADRVVAKHRGFVRPVAQSGGSCFMSYVSESTTAWNDLQACMEESYDDPWWWGPFARLACNAVWAIRAESAWFEYLKCLSPMSTVAP